ncbi:MAG: terpene cyclase/mutase family protein [Candidatus Wallbacteria bacterium]|nr:terpene cyclase/mutase family protein [Candidatus Wallbacteria bacterium]
MWRGWLVVLLLASGRLAHAGSPAQVAERGERWLSSVAASDGGFGYVRGGGAFTAPTAMAVLALEPGAVRGRALEWLRARQLPDGSWPVCEGDPEGSWMTAAAVLALSVSEMRKDEAAIARGRGWLLSRSIAYRSIAGSAQRSGTGEAAVARVRAAPGWPWTPGTAPWVEPTGWALLALARAPRQDEAGERRLAEAVEYLTGEVNRQGGWSLYESRPYPYHTALVLLALDQLTLERSQARGLQEALAGARAFLAGALQASSPAQDLAWALWALARGVPEIDLVAKVTQWLEARQRPSGSWEESPWLTAVAVTGLRALYGHDPLSAPKEHR